LEMRHRRSIRPKVSPDWRTSSRSESKLPST
jgi:hypothetical protein